MLGKPLGTSSKCKQVACGPAVPLQRIMPKRNKNVGLHRNSYTVIVALFIVAKKWKQPKYSSADENNYKE